MASAYKKNTSILLRTGMRRTANLNSLRDGELGGKGGRKSCDKTALLQRLAARRARNPPFHSLVPQQLGAPQKQGIFSAGSVSMANL